MPRVKTDIYEMCDFEDLSERRLKILSNIFKQANNIPQVRTQNKRLQT